MNRLIASLCLTLMAAAAPTLVAHDMTYLGTVATVAPAKLVVNVTDEKTKKTSAMTFAITEKTRIIRGEKSVTLADAHIAKNERVAVTINHDEPGQTATIIRLATRK